MAGEQDRGAALEGGFFDGLQDLDPVLGIEECRRLVQQDEIGPAGEGSGDAGFLELPVTERGDVRIGKVFDLKNLKIVRICGTTFTFITKAQVEELKEKLPDTTYVSDYGGDPTKSGGWRYKVGGGLTERYALLREQMGYDLNWRVRLTTSPSGEED